MFVIACVELDHAAVDDHDQKDKCTLKNPKGKKIRMP